MFLSLTASLFFGGFPATRFFLLLFFAEFYPFVFCVFSFPCQAGAASGTAVGSEECGGMKLIFVCGFHRGRKLRFMQKGWGGASQLGRFPMEVTFFPLCSDRLAVLAVSSNSL